MSSTAPLQTLATKPQPLKTSAYAGLLQQRKCACGSPTSSLAGECAECTSKKLLQTKLAIGASNDPLEQEADRVADQVLAGPARPAVSGALPRIQRFTGHAAESVNTAPASVDRVLASSGRPLEPVLLHDMEQRFGHDFSRVRVHTDATAAQSAKTVDALAYTVGRDIVFAEGRYAPTTADGRRLLAHELVHTVQSTSHVARQEAPQQTTCITGKQEGAGQNLKPTLIGGRTYSYLIWGQWQASDSLDTFRSRILPKWVIWRFQGISAVERQAVTDFLQSSRFVPFDTTVLKPDCCYSLPLEDVVIKQARALSGEAAREKAAKQAKEQQAGGVPDDAKDAEKQSAGGVTAGGGTKDKQKTNTSDAGDPAGQKSVQVTGDHGVLAGNGPLAQLYLGFLGRYAGVKADPKQAEQGLSRDQVTAITAGNEQAQVVTDLFTQGWVEYGKVGGSDVVTFGFMEEALLTQRDRGNFTALHNQLEFSNDPDGLGLYKRGTPLRYYDANGQPVPTDVGGYRDPGYRAAAPPAHALKIPITDRGLLQVLSGIKNVTLDDQILIYNSAKGYYDNGDLLWPAVLNGWDGWVAVSAELKRQLPAVVFFIGLEGVATVLKKMQDPKAKGAGLLLEAMLEAAGKAFHFIFVSELADLVYSCGLELSKIQRQEGSSELDALSQQHVERAAVQMRQLLTLVLAAGLTAAIVKTARETAVTLSPPKGGGLVPAGAGAGIPQGGTAAARGPSPSPPPYMIPLPPTQLESRGGGSGDAAKKTNPPKDPAKASDKPAGDQGANREKPADGATKGEPKPADPKAAAKARLEKRIEEVRERNLQIFSEIEEAARPGKQQPSAQERAALQNEARNAVEEAEKLRKALADLETTPYAKARAYSYSDVAAEEVIRRSRGLDEVSGTKAEEPSIDHVVPVAEMVEFEGWNELSLEDQQAILSRTDNLRLMEKRLNFSKGSKRWANWEEGRRAYGEEAWSRMVQSENSLRQSIREDIKTRAQQRHR